MQCVDGFVLVVPRRNVKAYVQLAKHSGKIWREHGALEYRECVGDNLNVKMGLPFSHLTKPKAGETVVFSWIVYKSRAHRNKVNVNVIKDPRMNGICDAKSMPFDMKRMSFGGVGVLVSV